MSGAKDGVTAQLRVAEAHANLAKALIENSKSGEWLNDGSIRVLAEAQVNATLALYHATLAVNTPVRYVTGPDGAK